MDTQPNKPTQERRLSHKKMHWFLASVKVDFLKEIETAETDEEGNPVIQRYEVSRTFNTVVHSPARIVVAKTLTEIRDASVFRAKEQFHIDPSKIVDICVLNLNYMGQMSEHEHFTAYQDQPEPHDPLSMPN